MLSKQRNRSTEAAGQIKRQLRRMTRLVELDAPSIIILQDILLLGERLSGGTRKFIKFVLKAWWQISRANPMHHYRLWRMSRIMSPLGR